MCLCPPCRKVRLGQGMKQIEISDRDRENQIISYREMFLSRIQ